VAGAAPCAPAKAAPCCPNLRVCSYASAEWRPSGNPLRRGGRTSSDRGVELEVEVGITFHCFLLVRKVISCGRAASESAFPPPLPLPPTVFHASSNMLSFRPRMLKVSSCRSTSETSFALRQPPLPLSTPLTRGFFAAPGPPPRARRGCQHALLRARRG
jgi:hypothetical protein